MRSVHASGRCMQQGLARLEKNGERDSATSMQCSVQQQQKGVKQTCMRQAHFSLGPSVFKLATVDRRWCFGIPATPSANPTVWPQTNRLLTSTRYKICGPDCKGVWGITTKNEPAMPNQLGKLQELHILARNLRRSWRHFAVLRESLLPK
jgi:hypothetical protein